MTKTSFAVLERHMRSHMNDGAHDEQHVYRVLYAALDIARGREVDLDVLVAAALLHDIGREAQFKDGSLDHALVGADLAGDFLRGIGWPEKKAGAVSACIRTHRYRKNAEPESLEAKILFDADKLDATGTLGIARTLAYKGIMAEPLYSRDAGGRVLDGSADEAPSFFQEYHWKLKRVYDVFYTDRARELAETRQKAGSDFYRSMLEEVRTAHETGSRRLDEILAGPAV